MINLNYEWYPKIDLTLDITKQKLPIINSKLDGVYSEHVIEHLPPESLPFVFSEIRRVLKPGGVLRLVIPDAGLYLDIYSKLANGQVAVFPGHNHEWTAMEHVNRVFRDYGHLYAYDYPTLYKLLDKAGFIDINVCQHRNGRDPNLLVDSDERESESLRVEALSPYT